MNILTQVKAHKTGSLPHFGLTVTIIAGSKSRSYYLFITPAYVTVLTGKYARLGKTFHADTRYNMNEADFVKNYKQHGNDLLAIVHEYRAKLS